MATATKTLPTITLNMHQRIATDGCRTHRRYILIDGGPGPELITPRTGDWDEYPEFNVANVDVELPEICWGSAEEIRRDICEAAIKEAERMGLISFPWS